MGAEREQPMNLVLAIARIARQPGQALGVVAAAIGVFSAIIMKASR
jgi:hypothetical protein